MGPQSEGSVARAAPTNANDADRETLAARLGQLDEALASFAGSAVEDDLERSGLRTERTAVAVALAAAEDELVAQLPPATARLVQARDDNNSSVRFSAIQALGERLTPGLRPVLRRHLDDSDDYVREYAHEYYAKLLGRDAKPFLVMALGDRDSSIRFSAIQPSATT